MDTKKLENVVWYRDRAAAERGEPGLWHSFVGALATVLQARDEPVDPAWLMGATGFAFRTYAHVDLCPSAMSMFDWDALLPEAVAQTGYRYAYISRGWAQEGLREARRAAAHAQIRQAIDAGRPVIVWDIGIPEWGVITGYDDATRQYAGLSCLGREETLGYDELGEREIKVLSVTVVKEPNGRSRDDVIRRSLGAAVAHALQQEWEARDRGYQDGPLALGMWAEALARGDETVNWEHTDYYAATIAAARCYARDYLAAIAGDDPDLLAAADAYGRAAAALLPVWHIFRDEQHPPADLLRAAVTQIEAAKAAELAAIDRLAAYLQAESELVPA